MAKATAIEGYRPKEEGGGPGWKGCPECGGFVRGPKTAVCPACQHEFPKPVKSGEKPAKSQTKLFHETSLEDALLYVLRSGGVDKAKKGIEGLKTNPCMEFAISCGGVDKALEKIAEVAAKIG